MDSNKSFWVSYKTVCDQNDIFDCYLPFFEKTKCLAVKWIYMLTNMNNLCIYAHTNTRTTQFNIILWRNQCYMYTFSLHIQRKWKKINQNQFAQSMRKTEFEYGFSVHKWELSTATLREPLIWLSKKRVNSSSKVQLIIIHRVSDGHFITTYEFLVSHWLYDLTE